MAKPEWLEVIRGDAPLLISIPHAGTMLLDEIRPALSSQWLARKDADWWLEKLYAFAHREFGATIVRTHLSRTLIDVNRDPSGASLYPGQATTELCPATTFDGEPLYKDGQVLDADEIDGRRAQFFDPYHAALREELMRLQGKHPDVVLYDAHSIRSRIPRLFAGELPHLNLGTNRGASCDSRLQALLAGGLARSPFSHVVNGRFVGGWITRQYGRPEQGIHAVQMEIACRSYIVEPEVVSEENWPPVYRPEDAELLQQTLRALLTRCIAFAQNRPQRDDGQEEITCHE